jgi:hypothetical protein
VEPPSKNFLDTREGIVHAFSPKYVELSGLFWTACAGLRSYDDGEVTGLAISCLSCLGLS